MTSAKPRIRAVVSKAQLGSPSLLKAFPPAKPKPEKDEKGQVDGKTKPGAKPGTSGGGKPGAGLKAPEMKMGPEKKTPKDRPTLEGVSHEEYENEGEEDEFGNKESDKGQSVKFHPEVEALIPEDADYHHHVTEHAKHAQLHLVLKNQDPKKAEAHRHAANLHAKIGNALHSAGETEKDHGKVSPEEAQAQNPLGSFQDPYAEDPAQGPPGAQGAAQGPPGAPPGPPGAQQPGKGAPVPGKPDGLRDAPGRDSQIEAKKKAAGGKSPFGKSRFFLKKHLHRTGVPYSFLAGED